MSQVNQTVHDVAIQPLYTFGKWFIVAGIVMLITSSLAKMLASHLGMNRKQTQALAQPISFSIMLCVLLIGLSKTLGI